MFYELGGSSSQHQEAIVNPVNNERTEIPRIYEESSPELMAVVGFQNNINQVIIEEKLEQLQAQGLLTAEEAQAMSPIQKQEKAMQEIMYYMENHAAAYKFLVMDDATIFDKIYAVEKYNPGPALKKDASADKKEEYLKNKIRYDDTQEDRTQVAHRVLEELRTEKMRVLNKVMEGLKVGKAIKRGGIKMAEFMEYVRTSFDELFQKKHDEVSQVMNNPELAQEIFSSQVQNILNNRVAQESKKSAN